MRARSRRTVAHLVAAPRAVPSTSGCASGTAGRSSSRSLRAELVGAEVAQFRGLHSIFSCAKRVANFVRIGSFAAASRIASRASVSVTPSISNSTRPGPDDAHPLLGRALALAHAGFLRLLGDRLVGEHAHPDLAAALDEAGHRDARRLDLPIGQPARLERLQPVVAERHVGPAPRLAAPCARAAACGT